MYAPSPEVAYDIPYIAAYHGSNGPIQSTFQRSVLSLFPDYLEPTLRAVGYAIPEDRNGGDAVGAGYLPLAIRPQNYTRSYSGSVYTSVENRPNLHVLTSSQVTRIIWRSTTPGNVTAAGLEYLDISGSTLGSPQRINAREVIISAGIIQSPQILQLSGVGDSSVLSPLGIASVVDNSAVGTGFHDPPMMNYLPISFQVNTTFTGGEYMQNFIQLEPASHMLNASDYAAASAWLNSTSSIPGVPDSQLAVFKTLWETEQPLIELAWQFTTQNVTPYNLVPLSQGTVLINSSDPLAPPAIDPKYNYVRANISGYGEVDWDMWFLAKAAQHYTTQLCTTPPLSSIITSSDPPYDLPFEEFYQRVFERTGSSQHLTGGNPMLPRESGGVVDTSFKVYGTNNVRVVDGSIFPYQPSAHPMGLTYALAIMAAKVLQLERGGGGLTDNTLPHSNASANPNLTAPFPPDMMMSNGAETMGWRDNALYGLGAAVFAAMVML